MTCVAFPRWNLCKSRARCHRAFSQDISLPSRETHVTYGNSPGKLSSLLDVHGLWLNTISLKFMLRQERRKSCLSFDSLSFSPPLGRIPNWNSVAETENISLSYFSWKQISVFCWKIHKKIYFTYACERSTNVSKLLSPEKFDMFWVCSSSRLLH